MAGADDSYCVCVVKQKTAYEMGISDWSSDVCSSDLPLHLRAQLAAGSAKQVLAAIHAPARDRLQPMMREPAEVVGIHAALHQDKIAKAEKRVEETGGVLDVRKGMQTLGRPRSLGTQGECRTRPDDEDMVGHVQRSPGHATIGPTGGPPL